ncbi:MAG: recombinase family protein, partial [Bdellovibrionales bacterium]
MKRIAKSLKNQLYRIAIYTRVSTEEQAENPEGSIKNQEQRIREYIKLKNMVEPFGEVVTVFSDPGKSAKDMNRPGFQKMLSAIRSHDIDMVVVTELSRFSRSTKDFTMLQEFLDEQGCKFVSLRENFDTSGAAGSMVMNLMASIAEFERRQTAERISNSFLARSKRGLYNG